MKVETIQRYVVVMMIGAFCAAPVFADNARRDGRSYGYADDGERARQPAREWGQSADDRARASEQRRRLSPEEREQLRRDVLEANQGGRQSRDDRRR